MRLGRWGQRERAKKTKQNKTKKVNENGEKHEHPQLSRYSQSEKADVNYIKVDLECHRNLCNTFQRQKA